ncbi:HWE histidine kinase domain-containing protein [Dankookia sp. P2]|uniref:HWE histidine kinase domain-containing protein n=1 Tax=Dankookia sp. P2 TaxID=3423955 RepID=UPI003D675100
MTERRQAEDRQVLMTRELDHRAKNALAVVLAALRLTPAGDPRAYATAVEGRVAALARAHTLLTERRWTGTDLAELVRGELRPVLPPDQPDRLQIEGPAVLLAPQAAQPLAIALHELATNAARHGALSGPAGQVAVGWSIGREDAALHLTWREYGGPKVAGAPQRLGFGWRVMRASLTEQLGGRLDCHWPATGLVCEVALPAARVLAEPARPPLRPPV